MAEKTMSKDDVPRSFGVFKPVGHVVLAFPDPEGLRGAREALTKAGFGRGDVVEYSAQEMLAQIGQHLDEASGAAGFGYEINLLKLHRQLAEQGHGWLVVLAPEEAQWTEVARVVRRFNPSAAHRYGKLVVEELLTPPQAKAGF
jgi:hypothetical protein